MFSTLASSLPRRSMMLSSNTAKVFFKSARERAGVVFYISQDVKTFLRTFLSSHACLSFANYQTIHSNSCMENMPGQLETCWMECLKTFNNKLRHQSAVQCSVAGQHWPDAAATILFSTFNHRWFLTVHLASRQTAVKLKNIFSEYSSTKAMGSVRKRVFLEMWHCFSLSRCCHFVYLKNTK